MNQADYEKSEEERAFVRAVIEGMADLDEGREKSLDEVKALPGLA
jgi:hypothetical protein